VSSTREDLRYGLEMVKWAFSNQHDPDPEKIKKEIVENARIARKESLLALEARIPMMTDPFLKHVSRHIIDGLDPVVVRDLFENQIRIEEEKMNSAAKIWSDAGGFSPTVGIIGAVLGLIHVMSNLSDTSKLGAGIAVAFVATVYGVGSANLLFLPLANKIKKKIKHRILVKEMILEGSLSILIGLNPLVIEQKMKSFTEKDFKGDHGALSA
jgi:chemotaxis protein MotA